MANGRVDNPILAIGMVSVTERAADSLYRVKWALDSKSYPDALEAVLALTRHVAATHNWNAKTRYSDIAKAVTDYWLADLCPSCTGIGAEVVTGTPMLGGACPACRGSGKRAYPWIQEPRYHVAVLVALEDAERRIRGKLIDKLAHEIRDSGVLNNV
jgi:hypothetical protein